MKKISLLLALFTIITSCTTKSKPKKNINSICKKCYSTPISLSNSEKKIYNKWGDREFGNKEESSINNISCDSFNKIYLKENCDSLTK